MKEFKVIHNDASTITTAKELTKLAQEGWEVVNFTDHLTLLTKETKEQEALNEG